MDRLNKPVTYQDIAKLVSDTAGERAKKRKFEQKDAAGTLGDLILDALHDFSGGAAEAAPTSLGTRGLSAPASSGDFVNPSEWGLDALFDDAPAPQRSAPARPVSSPTAAPVPPPAGAPAASPQPPLPAAQRARPTPAGAPAEGGPFWRRWFGS
jgi:hypothetical protein